jgi:hypothetical protein
VTFDTILTSNETHRKLHNTNKRIVGTAKLYDIESKSGQYTATPNDDWDFEIVEDAGNKRSTVTASRLKPDRTNTGFYATPEIYYAVLRDGDQYYIKDFIARNSDLLGFVRQTTQGPEWMPSSFDGARSLEFTSLVFKDNSRLAYTFSVGTPTRTTRFGKEVVSVTSELTPKAGVAGVSSGSVRQTSYFDPNNSLVYLGSEASESATTQRPWSRLTVCTLEYRARDGSYPVPKRFTRYVKPEKSDKLLEFEIDYTRFEDYVPDPEEFRLEKRYGLTTPAGPDRKALVGVRSTMSSRVWYWGSILLGAVLVGLVGIIYFRRRR